ncbi:MAG: T9SS type A sorting domain-containing protein, partial [Bacteroidetes bacterium]|nr:T9SS type A sorting domain-containing protein [Bacteroidota bacterium]
IGAPQNDTNYTFQGRLIKEDENIAIFPNPANDLLKIELYSNKNSNRVSIEILDFLGRSVKKIEKQAFKGKNHFELPVENLSDGLYNVQIITNGRKINKKVLISN